MADSVTILGLGGSLDLPSHSMMAVEVALEGAAAEGATTHALDVRELDLPLFSPYLTTLPEGVRRLLEATTQADGLVWSSPLYHGSVSGAFKNAVDWLELLRKSDPPYLTDKPVGLVSTAGGTHALQAINTMDYIVRALRGWVVPLTAPVAHASKAFNAERRATDEHVREQLHAVGREVTRAARIFARRVITTSEIANAATVGEVD